MGFPKLPTVGGYKVSISPKTSTDDTYDGTGKTNIKRDRSMEAARWHVLVTRPAGHA